MGVGLNIGLGLFLVALEMDWAKVLENVRPIMDNRVVVIELNIIPSL